MKPSQPALIRLASSFPGEAPGNKRQLLLPLEIADVTRLQHGIRMDAEITSRSWASRAVSLRSIASVSDW
jgi:hypothetical protein